MNRWAFQQRNRNCKKELNVKSERTTNSGKSLISRVVTLFLIFGFQQEQIKRHVKTRKNDPHRKKSSKQNCHQGSPGVGPNKEFNQQFQTYSRTKGKYEHNASSNY